MNEYIVYPIHQNEYQYAYNLSCKAALGYRLVTVLPYGSSQWMLTFERSTRYNEECLRVLRTCNGREVAVIALQESEREFRGMIQIDEDEEECLDYVRILRDGGQVHVAIPAIMKIMTSDGRTVYNVNLVET